MKILFCPQCKVSRELGGSKVSVELADAMAELGWDIDIKSVPDLCEKYALSGPNPGAQALKRFLQENADHYDVVDYDHLFLPFPRDIFPPKPLFIARSVLLRHHLMEIKFPEPRSPWYRLKALIRRRHDLRELVSTCQDADRTVKEADLVNVSNHRDLEALARHGVNPQKIVVLPYGIDAIRRKLFNAIGTQPPPQPKVAFVGTFDLRKGCVDFPKIAAAIVKAVPHTTFKLLGTAGLYQTEAEARRFFPARLQHALEFKPRYAAADLPLLLSDCSAGIFPSYLEGFGFGLIEMLAAAVPVIAYDAPGPSSILNSEGLVAPGDIAAMAGKIIRLLQNSQLLQSERIAAQSHSQQYNWPKIAADTDVIYRKQLARHLAKFGESVAA